HQAPRWPLVRRCRTDQGQALSQAVQDQDGGAAIRGHRASEVCGKPLLDAQAEGPSASLGVGRTLV
ncbi:hypothetical protein FA258_22190, partial [Pseudomonas aeruginosa]|nr:hypothetical protein [Pseudomonas aeruginosa]